jgi:SAM-dependent methyltransferase
VSELHPNTAGFTGQAAQDYDAARGTYPPEVIEAIGLDPGSRVLDLGAGTGLLSQGLAAAGHDVIAVEPLADMRAQLADKLGPENALEGTAEAIPLPDQSADAATAAESFHWFKPDAAAAELHRVVRPGGLVALIWRWPEWNHSTEWVAKVVAEVLPLRGDDHPAFTPDRGRDGFARHGGFSPIELTELRYPQTTDRQGYLDWVRSWSFISKIPVPEREALLDRLRPLIPDTPLDVSVRVELWTGRRI